MDDTPVDIATVMVSELEYLRGILSFTVEAADGTELLHVDREEAGTLVTPPVRRDLAAIRAARAGENLRVRVTNRPAVTVLAHVDGVAGYGWQAWSGAGSAVAPVTATEVQLANGNHTVDIDPATGTFAIDGHAGLGALIDGGDVGDTYNWCPPDVETLVDSPTAVTTRVLESGPMRARLEVLRTYELPTHVDGQARVGSQTVEVRTVLELRAGDDVVRVRVSFDNHGLRDHRLRVHLPLPSSARSSHAECAFAVVERGLTAEGGPTEQGLPTYPSRRFVSAGGLTVVHAGLLEYELVDIDGDAARTLAVTLLRCTGMLSQGPMATRPLPAGPLTPMEGPQQQTRVSASFAIHVGDRDPYAIVDDAFLTLLVTRGGGAGAPGPDAGHALSVTGAEVSAIVREAGQLHVRVFNPTDEATTVTIDGRQGWLIDLRGRPITPFEGTFDLSPWQIATATLT
jgi:hypothetical protein